MENIFMLESEFTVDGRFVDMKKETSWLFNDEFNCRSVYVNWKLMSLSEFEYKKLKIEENLLIC